MKIGEGRGVGVRPATLKELAREAGVSIATASKVLNGIRQGMSAETAERVLRVASEIGYRPNRTARSLRTLRQLRIGMVIVDPSPGFLADPFTTHLTAGLANRLSQEGFGLLLHGLHPRRIDDSFLVRTLEVDAMGVMLSGSASARSRLRQRLGDLRHPLVIFQERPDFLLEDACFVRQDDRGGAADLAKRLLERRPNRVLGVVPKLAWSAIEERVKGLRDVLMAARVAVNILRCDETDASAVMAAIDQELDRSGPPDAIVGGNDRIAAAALAILRRRRIAVPREVGVTGFNAFPFATVAEPGLTTVASPAYELGVAGGEALLERMQGPSFPQKEILLPVRLVPGDTDLA